MAVIAEIITGVSGMVAGGLTGVRVGLIHRRTKAPQHVHTFGAWYEQGSEYSQFRRCTADWCRLKMSRGV